MKLLMRCPRGFGLVFLFLIFQVFIVEAKSPVGKGKAKVDVKWENEADKNKDGVEGLKEAEALQKDKSEINTGWEKRADVNQDGIVDESELFQWEGIHPSNWKDKADLNRDGIVDDHELSLWKDKHSFPSGFKKKADLNNDGIVDDKELRLWKEKHPGSEE